MRKKVLRSLMNIMLMLLLCTMLAYTPVYADGNSSVQEGLLDDFQETREPDNEREQQLQDKIVEIIDTLNIKNKQDEDKIFAVYNYVCQNVAYDWQATNDMSSWDGYSLGHGQFAYEALCMNKAVCAGISKAIYRLLSEVDVEAYYVTGLSDGIPHAWNIVKLNDVYYYLDATSDIGKLQYNFYLKGSSDFTGYGISTECIGSKLQVSVNSLYDSIEAQMESKDGFRYNAGIGDITIFSYNGAEENVIVPSVIDGRPVKRIVQYAFQYNQMRTLELSEGIEDVTSLFVGQCNQLEKIILPSTANIVPASSGSFVSGIDGFVDSCYMLNTIEVAADNPYLTVIDGVLYDKGLTTIIACPASSTIEEIHIPEGISAIRGDAFAHNKNIRKIVLPDSVTYIGYWAFDNCSLLEEINIPANCKFIGQFAFQGTSIKHITIPAESTCTIMNSSFNHAPLESIEVEPGNAKYSVYDGVLYEDNYALLYETNNKREKLNLLEGTETIGQCTFSGCNYLKEITIPASVKKIQADAFESCEELECVNIEGTSLVSIERSAFLNCHKLKKISIPNSVKSIGNSALNGCYRLYNITIPNGITIMPEDLFGWNLYINTVCIPKSVKEIENDFLWNMGISRIIIFEGSETEWNAIEKNDNTFDNITVFYDNNVCQHEWDENYTVYEEPFCTRSGVKVIKCKICGGVKENSELQVPELGHDYQVNQGFPAGCEYSGYSDEIRCTRCSSVIKYREEIPATGHTIVTDEAVAPTCAESGLTEGSHCSVCNEVIKAQEEVPALGHTWNDGEVTTAPTCTEIGVKTFTCTACGEIRTEDIKAKGHTVVVDETVAPTCTETGLTEGSHCSVCNEVIKAQEEVAALGHTWDDGEVTTTPTCTKTGVKTFTCTACGEIRTEDIKATGHTVVTDEAVAPTCTETGLTEGSHCSVCNEVIKAQEEVAALGHTWDDGEVTTAPTCTKTGVKTFTCTACGETRTEDIKETGHTVVVDEAVAPTCTETGLTEGSHCSVCNEVIKAQEEVPALGHTWNDGEVTTAPTCTKTGVKTFTCTACGETRTEDIKETGHTVVVDKEITPTCTETGLTEGSHCNVCNEVIKAQEEVPALGHIWDDGEVTTAPTCTKTGVKTFTCTACGEIRTEDIKATGHTVVEDKALAPTCTEPGLTEGSHCSVCNEVIKAQEEVAALGHTWNDGEITTVPTCTKTGVKTFTCTACGKTKTEDVKATGHTVVVDEAVAPTCTETGLTEGCHCSVCNEVIKAQEEVPALGHTWDDGEVTTAPTCTKTGIKTFTCTTCGETRTEDIKATGHTVVVDEAVAPTCTEPGLTEGSHCSVCSELIKEQEEVAALGHTWGDGEITTAPTCTKTGIKTFTCTACGQTRTEDIKATGHTVVTDEAIAPTCTETGLTEGSHCSVCNEVIKAQEEVPALGHIWDDGEVTTAPTCTKTGVKTFTCTACGEIRTEDIKETGHTVVVDEAVAPTCTKTGLTEGSHCSVCNEVIKAQEEVPALGHKWDSGNVTKKPTYTAKGIKTYTCTVCSDTKTGDIPVLKRVDITKAASKISVAGIENKIYNGKAQTQAKLVVKANGRTLTKGTDYTVTYRNNKNIGTATLTITGENGYTGTIKKTFAIKTQAGKVYGSTLKYKITSAKTNGTGTVSLIGSGYSKTNKKFTTLKVSDTVTIGGVKFKVTKIENKAFMKYQYLTNVVVGSNVTSIGDYAFYGCPRLATVTVGKNIRTIGTKAFYGCKSLRAVKILSPKLVKAGTSAFAGIKANAAFALPKKYYNSYGRLIKKAGAPKKAVYKKF